MIDVRAAGRDLAIGVSLANLVFMRVWAELFAVASPKESYDLKLGNRELLAVALDLRRTASGDFFSSTQSPPRSIGVAQGRRRPHARSQGREDSGGLIRAKHSTKEVLLARYG